MAACSPTGNSGVTQNRKFFSKIKHVQCRESKLSRLQRKCVKSSVFNCYLVLLHWAIKWRDSHFSFLCNLQHTGTVWAHRCFQITPASERCFLEPAESQEHYVTVLVHTETLTNIRASSATTCQPLCSYVWIMNEAGTPRSSTLSGEPAFMSEQRHRFKTPPKKVILVHLHENTLYFTTGIF